MLHPLPRAAAAVALACALLGPAPFASDNAFDASAFLRTYAGFSNHDLTQVASGTADARSLHADSDEVAVAAAVFMAVPRQLFLERFRDIAAFKRNPLLIAIGKFASPPAAADMRELTLDEDDLSALRHCKPGDCDMRLDTAGIEKLRAVAGRNGGSDKDTSMALREHLAAYAAGYLARGDEALMEYHDRERPRRIANDLGPIIGRSPYFERELSAMRQDVARFAGAAKSTNEHMLYWSSEKIASTPVISMTHVIISNPAPGLTAIASRQIYASHFFHASLGLTLVADTTGPGGPGITVIYLNRSRVDAFSGLLGPVKRGAVRSRARGTAERLLNGLRLRLEGKK
jgi:hypothetical protein